MTHSLGVTGPQSPQGARGTQAQPEGSATSGRSRNSVRDLRSSLCMTWGRMQGVEDHSQLAVGKLRQERRQHAYGPMLPLVSVPYGVSPGRHGAGRHCSQSQTHWPDFLPALPLPSPGPQHSLGPLTVTLSSPLPAPLVNTLKSATSFTRTPLGCRPRPEARQALGLQAAGWREKIRGAEGPETQTEPQPHKHSSPTSLGIVSQARALASCHPRSHSLEPDTTGALGSPAGQGGYKKPLLLGCSECHLGQRHGRAWAERGAKRERRGPQTTQRHPPRTT